MDLFTHHLVNRPRSLRDANAAAERMLGWSATEMQGQPAHRLFHHTRADGTPYPVEECPMDRARVAREDCRSDDELFWRKDGRFFPVDIAGAPIVSADGSVVVFRDISERRAAEAARQRLLGELRLNNERLSAAQEQLTRQEEEQRALLENLRDGVITIDAGGSIRAFNPAVCAIFDQPPEALQDQDLTRLIPPELRERHLRGLARHVLTSGIERLAAQGATRIKICFEPGNPASRELYLDVGFRPVKQTDMFTRPAPAVND